MGKAQQNDTISSANIFLKLASIRQQPASIKKTETIIDLSRIISKSSTSLSELLDESIDYSQKAQRNDLMVLLYVAKGKMALLAGDTVNAISNTSIAENYFTKLNGEASPEIIKDIADACLRNGQPAKGLLYYKKIVEHDRYAGDDQQQIRQLYDLSKVYTALNKKREVKLAFEKAIGLTSKMTDKKMLHAVTIDYADRLEFFGEKKEAVDIYKTLVDEAGLSEKNRIHILSRLVINLVKLNKYSQADDYHKLLVEAVRTQGDEYNVDEYLLATAMVQESHKQYLQAKSTYFNLAMGADKKNEIYEEAVIRLAGLYSAELKKDSADHYFSLVSGLGNKTSSNPSLHFIYTTALRQHQQRFQQKYLLVNDLTKALSEQDSQYRQELLQVTNELGLKYRVLESEQEVKQVKHQRELETLVHARSKQRLLLILLSLLVVFLMAVSAIYFLYQRKRQSELLHEKEKRMLQQFHRVETMKLLAVAQESERGRIADQLHDEVGSMLSVARLNLSTAYDSSILKNVNAENKLKTTEKILGDVAETIRDMSHQLMPVALKKYGLKKAVQQLVTDINKSEKIYVQEVFVGFDQTDKYSEVVQVSIYRIIQELLQNIIKHSMADRAILQLIEHDDVISLMVEDNGTGIMEMGSREGKGMHLLASRIEYLEGKMNTESSEDGTLIFIEIPTKHLIKSLV